MNFTDHWAAKRTQQEAITQSGRVLVRVIGGRLHVSVPPKTAFESHARQFAGRWKAKTHSWSFSANQRALVMRTLRRVFGEQRIVEE